jgi:DNA-binding transcriptional ArsR family regulator
VDLDRTFSALADPTRRQLLVQLERGPRTLTELATPLPITLMAVQKHVRVLEEAGLVKTVKQGRSRHVRLRAHGLERASHWIQQSAARWNAAFDRLAIALQADDEADGQDGQDGQPDAPRSD